MSAPPLPLDQSRARAYARVKFRLSLASGAYNLVLLAAFLFTGASLAFAHWLGGRWAFNVLAYTVALCLGLQILGLPFDFWSRAVEIRFDLNRQSLADWWLDQLKGLVLGLILFAGAGEVVYALLHAAPQHWWRWAWLAFVAFILLIALIGPVLLMPLFFKFRRMSGDNPDDAALVQRLESTYARLRAANPRLPALHGIFEWKLGEKSAKANAALTGWGRSRRVIISDTLLAASPPEEIEAVFIHELGHHVHRDIWRMIATQSALGLLGLYLAQLALRALAPALHLASLADVAGLPLLVLVFTILGIILLPVSNALVRAMERAADDYSFEQLGASAPLIAGLERLASQNLAEIEPPRWKEFLLYSHPSIATRIRRGRAWQALHAKSAAE